MEIVLISLLSLSLLGNVYLAWKLYLYVPPPPGLFDEPQEEQPQEPESPPKADPRPVIPPKNKGYKSTGISAFGVKPGIFKEDSMITIEFEGMTCPAMVLARSQDFEFITFKHPKNGEEVALPWDGKEPPVEREIRKGLAPTKGSFDASANPVVVRDKKPIEATPEEIEAFEAEILEVANELQRELAARRAG